MIGKMGKFKSRTFNDRKACMNATTTALNATREYPLSAPLIGRLASLFGTVFWTGFDHGYKTAKEKLSKAK
jgi:hypothetical protein